MRLHLLKPPMSSSSRWLCCFWLWRRRRSREGGRDGPREKISSRRKTLLSLSLRAPPSCRKDKYILITHRSLVFFHKVCLSVCSTLYNSAFEEKEDSRTTVLCTFAACFSLSPFLSSELRRELNGNNTERHLPVCFCPLSSHSAQHREAAAFDFCT